MIRILCNLCILAVISFVFPSLTFAAPYGTGTFGSSNYGVMSTATPAQSSTNSSGGSSGNTCTAQAPSSAPNLFQIDRLKDTATLYFAPAGNPNTNYFISFGYAEGDERFGLEFSTSNVGGAITYTINKLSPQTVYYFKVRGGNSCMPGPWSNSIPTAKVAAGGKKKISFYPPKNSLRNTVYQTARTIGYSLSPKSRKNWKTAAVTGRTVTKVPKGNQSARQALLDRIGKQLGTKNFYWSVNSDGTISYSL